MEHQELHHLNNHNNNQLNNNQQTQQQPPHQVIITTPQNDDLARTTVTLLLSSTARPEDFRDLLPVFSSPLKNHFENYGLWIRLGLTYLLSKESSSSTLQALNECIRLDEDDPMPAMLAAKLMLEDFDDPDNGLNLAEVAIKRCQNLANSVGSSSKFPNKLLSRSYLLASIMHAHNYEREPESIKQYKKDNLESSLNLLEMSMKANPNDHLVYFHKALHEARHRGLFQDAIDNLRRAIEINPQHIPSIQLLILSLSAKKQYDKALTLCESALSEHENNLLLLYIKCNLEQCLVETKGYKSALQTAQTMLKCIRRGTGFKKASVKRDSSTKLSTTSQSTQVLSLVASQQNQSQTLQLSQHQTMTNISTLASNTSATLPVPNTAPGAQVSTSPISLASVSNPKQMNNLFADDADSNSKSRKRREFLTGELSVWLLVAEIFVKIGSIEDAEQCVDEGSMHANGALSHQVMYVRGLIAKARNNLIEAKTFFQSSLALCPKYAKALQQIAHVYYLLGNYTTAEKFLRDSIDVDGDSYKTWHYLSLVYIELSQHDKAKDCVKKATYLEDTSPIVPISAISRLTFQ